MNVAVNCPCRSTAQRPADATMCSIVEWATTFVLFRISSLHRHVYTIPHCCAQLFSSAFSISLMSALEMRALKVTATHLTLRDYCRNVDLIYGLWRHTFKTELFSFCEVVRKHHYRTGILRAKVCTARHPLGCQNRLCEQKFTHPKSCPEPINILY